MADKKYIIQMEDRDKETGEVKSEMYPRTIPDAITGLLEFVEGTSRSYLTKITKLKVIGQNQNKITIPYYDGYILSSVICISNTLNICVGIGKNEKDQVYYAKLDEAIPEGEELTYRCIYNKL